METDFLIKQIGKVIFVHSEKSCGGMAAWLTKDGFSSFGDFKVKYFHRKATQRKIRNRITSLNLPNGTWCDDESTLRNEASSFFSSIYRITGNPLGKYPHTGHYSPTFPQLVQTLDNIPSQSEIRDALTNMAFLKARGLDGLHAEFFQKQWHIVGPDICRLIQGVFKGDALDPTLNRTTLVLIPKVESPQSFTDFLPISLCSVIYKLITNVIVRRLKRVMQDIILPNQTGFIADRPITEKIILNQEIVHSMKSKKTKQGWMAIKVDLEKAFDRLRWDFIQDSLYDVGFTPGIIPLVWKLWKRRNDFIFTSSCTPIDETCNLCSAWASHFQSNHSRQQQTPQPTTAAWTPPPPNWITLNTDASIIQPTGLSFSGGVFRDSSGTWKLRFLQAIGIMSPLHVELRNILIGLRISLNHGFENLIIQTDNSQAATLLSSPQKHTNTLPLIHAIMAMRTRFQSTEVLWTPRECNMVVDGMSRLYSLNYDLPIFELPPDHIQRLIHRDIADPRANTRPQLN
ncbi:hypothetical protein GQ457_13G011540 [Hibiscus cannabinus]